jgi:hypothetical protein
MSKSTFDNSFITKYEYGKMLYENPRGISCVKCHGQDARGKKIASFVHIRHKKKYNCEIRSNDITNISHKDFLMTLDPRLEKPKKKFLKNEVCKKLTYRNSMPTYFLTNEELNSIYFYLKNKDKY